MQVDFESKVTHLFIYPDSNDERASWIYAWTLKMNYYHCQISQLSWSYVWTVNADADEDVNVNDLHCQISQLPDYPKGR